MRRRASLLTATARYAVQALKSATEAAGGHPEYSVKRDGADRSGQPQARGGDGRPAGSREELHRAPHRALPVVARLPHRRLQRRRVPARACRRPRAAQFLRPRQSHIIEANIRSTKLSSPDYEHVDPDEAVTDFRARIAHYQRVYQPLAADEGAYLRVTGPGRGVTVSNVDGYLAARLVFFMTNLHLTARPIWLTRHGESVFNAAGVLGGDPDLTPAGHRYGRSLAEFLDRRDPDRDGVVIWTSSLRRAVQTAAPLGRTPWPWRALDEIDGGICDSMSHAQIQEHLPEEYAARKRDKFTYRYPRGESYQDIILRLDPVITELERTRKPVLVIAHNAVLRAIYAYFQGIPRERCPYLPIPLHTVIELTPHAYGCHETRMPLDPGLDSHEAR